VNDILKNSGIKFGQKFAQATIRKISGKTLQEINKKVGFRLVTKFGQKGIVNFGKAIPLIGGVVGAGFDVGSTKVIGKKSIDVFLK